MKYFFITSLLLTSFFACSPKKKEKEQKKLSTNKVQNLSFPFYLKTDSTIKIFEQKKQNATKLIFPAVIILLFLIPITLP